MTRGLVRANNFSDLTDKDQAVTNLGLSSVDYAALKGLYTTAGIDFAVIGEIGNSQGNYQAQLDGLSSTFSGIVLSGYVNRSGNSAITGNWSHSGIIDVVSGLPSGYPASTDSLFSLSIENGEAVIVASGLIASGLSYNGVRQSSSTVQRALPPSGFSPLHLIPLQVGGQGYFAEAGESPSFHIAPARLGHALDLVTGNLLGSYNSAAPAMAVGPGGMLFTPAANAPVIEYDPATLSCLGTRIWGVVANLRPYSEDIQATPATPDYSGTNATLVRQSTTTPIQGLGQATKLALNTGANTGNSTDGMTFGFGVTLSATTVYTQSIFARPAGSNILRLRSNLSGQVFDIPIAGPAPSPTGAITACTVQTGYANGWSRISWTFTTTTGAPGARADYWTLKTDVANSSDGIWLTGAQLNTGLIAPYVPTTTTAASSTADVWSITGADFNRIWNQAQGTIYGDGSSSSSGPFLVARATTTFNDRIQFCLNNLQSAVVFGGEIQYLSGIGTGKRAMAFAANDFAQQIQGQAINTDSAGAVPSVDYITIGRFDAGGLEFFNGYIRELAIFRSRRPNANLQALTT